jgi:hypothetical protein
VGQATDLRLSTTYAVKFIEGEMSTEVLSAVANTPMPGGQTANGGAHRPFNPGGGMRPAAPKTPAAATAPAAPTAPAAAAAASAAPMGSKERPINLGF